MKKNRFEIYADILRLVTESFTPIAFSTLSALLGKPHDRGTANYVRGAHKYYKNIGNDFGCGIIAGGIIDRNGKFAYKGKN